MDIATLLNQHSFEVQTLLRRFRVIGPVNMETIKRAHDQHGENFMMKLLEIITPDESSFTSLLMPNNQVIQDSFKYNAQLIEQQKAQKTGKFWGFWDNLLNGIGKTGQTIGNFKYDVNGQPVPAEMYAAGSIQAANRQTAIYIAAGALILIIILILVFKK